ncbi:MAG: hypothetical protein ABIK09_18900 [Pseudomonadota bacterium]
MGLWTVPTKVMLAGEYGVLAPGGRALALAVTPSLQVAAVPTPGVTVLRIQAAPGAAPREILPEAIASTPIDALHPSDHLPVSVWAVAREVGLASWPMVVDLRWRSDPDDWTPVGTSAAVAVGLALALTAGDADAALRLAWAGHARAQGGGSGYDVAACLLGGVVAFRAADSPLPRAAGGEEGWPSAEEARLAPGLHVVEAFTGRRAETRALLARLETARSEDPGVTLALAAHGDASAALIGALIGATDEPVTAAVDAAGATLAILDERLGGAILTDEIRTLVDVARRAGVPARVSGAGGGDGVVGFARSDWLASRLRMRWIQAGFAARVLEPAAGPMGGT